MQTARLPGCIAKPFVKSPQEKFNSKSSTVATRNHPVFFMHLNLNFAGKQYLGGSPNQGDTSPWNASSWSPALWNTLTYPHYQHVNTIRPNFFLVSFSSNCTQMTQLKSIFVPNFQAWKASHSVASEGQAVLVGACVRAITLSVVHKGSGQSTAWKWYATCDMHITWMIMWVNTTACCIVLNQVINFHLKINL